MPKRLIAYFSMEIALAPEIPTYSGGLGVLAGDTVNSAADLRVPMVAMTLLYRRGYFRQRLEPDGTQREEPVAWAVERLLKAVPQRTTVTLEGRTVHVRAWRFDVTGLTGHTVPVYFLDTDVPENAEPDRGLTHTLYGGDGRYRLCQEVILGIGGVRMLRELGYRHVERFHMNEGHAGLLTLELLDEEMKRYSRWSASDEDLERVRERCVFTTHTPVPAGHDQFPLELAKQVLPDRAEMFSRSDVFCCNGTLNLTYLALSLSRYVNGVAKKHGEVSQSMFAAYEIDAITNGVHVARWTSRPFQDLFTRYIPGWLEDNLSLRGALSIPPQEIWDAHLAAKSQLLEEVNRRTGLGMTAEALTLGFARRVATYKRADLLFHDPERLQRIVSQFGPLQIVYAGKAHPFDEQAKGLIKQIFEAKARLGGAVTIAYLEDYNTELARLLTAGVDVWLNTPKPPLEASGTSGMKAALNGVPSLSILDGWWVEGHIEGVTGWSIGEPAGATESHDDRSPRDAASLYDKLEHAVLPLFTRDRPKFIDVMRHAIALNGSFFNTQRMMQEYVLKAYFR
ncbi:MAG: alpha-glucan family phosphorylase [Candidatus Rokubacteria bacterium]|nr:alpha-glucan family phosphorylase [Candidatus Rokubacteria bacterium]